MNTIFGRASAENAGRQIDERTHEVNRQRVKNECIEISGLSAEFEDVVFVGAPGRNRRRSERRRLYLVRWDERALLLLSGTA